MKAEFNVYLEAYIPGIEAAGDSGGCYLPVMLPDPRLDY